MDRRPKQGNRPSVVHLDHQSAADPGLTGAKAANLARAAAAGLPVLSGAVLTTAWSPVDRASARDAWRSVSGGGTRAVVVRSSSTGEDGVASSMAGVFESVLDVRDQAAFDAAVDAVVASGVHAATVGLAEGQMAILVQPMLPVGWGGVLFTADPLTGRRDRLVATAAPSGPSTVVSGEVDGWTAALRRNGHIAEVRSEGAGAPPTTVLRGLAALARAVERTFGVPQDVEWSVDGAGELHLLQSRPITTLPPRSGPIFGPGPVAESFPDALSPLEQELWLDPMRDGLREALRLAGAATERQLSRTPLVVAVDGMPAVDLGALGADPAPRSFFAVLDPRPPARRLRASWRVGRLRRALPALADDVVRRVDRDLRAVPTLDELGNPELLAILGNGRRHLTSLHGYEALVGLLVPETEAAITGASLALCVVSQAAAEGASLDELAAVDPVVLALVPPRIGPSAELAGLVAAGATAEPAPSHDADSEPAAIAREALRLRIRWVQELMARAAWELGRRLAGVELLPYVESVRLLALGEVHDAIRHRTIPTDLALRTEPAGRRLPTRFRLADDGRAVAVAPVARRRHGPHGSDDGTGVGAGGGSGRGAVHLEPAADAPAGSVLIVSTLDPRLAAVIPRLGGLVAETGSPLSHLAILAREHGVPAVVGLTGATTRFPAGTLVEVDGHAGTVIPAPAPEVVDLTAQPDATASGDVSMEVQP